MIFSKICQNLKATTFEKYIDFTVFEHFHSNESNDLLHNKFIANHYNKLNKTITNH